MKNTLVNFLIFFGGLIWDIREDKNIHNIYEVINLLINYVINNDDISELGEEMYKLTNKFIKLDTSESEKNKIIGEIITRLNKK